MFKAIFALSAIYFSYLVSADIYPAFIVPVNNTQVNNPVGWNVQSWGCRPPRYNTTGTHSVFIGCVGLTDRLLYSHGHVKPGKWFSTRESYINFPTPGFPRQEVITGIWLFDRDRNGIGGYGRVTAGGVGQRQAVIQLYSTKWGRGFNYLVQIYGR